jgi:hypothetical protein
VGVRERDGGTPVAASRCPTETGKISSIQVRATSTSEEDARYDLRSRATGVIWMALGCEGCHGRPDALPSCLQLCSKASTLDGGSPSFHKLHPSRLWQFANHAVKSHFKQLPPWDSNGPRMDKYCMLAPLTAASYSRSSLQPLRLCPNLAGPLMITRQRCNATLAGSSGDGRNSLTL